MQERRKALVLGEKALARVLATQLEEEGFEPVLLSSLAYTLPLVTHPQCLEELRKMIKDFAVLSQGRGVIHPGATVWAERPELPSIASEFGLIVFGPSARILSFFGNQLNLLLDAEKCGVPHLIQGPDPMHTLREIEEFVRREHQTFPFVLKSIKGNGGNGIYIVYNEKSLGNELLLWMDQIRQNQGEVILFAERYLEGSRHIVLPFVRFQNERFQIFPISDASLQSRNRKILEIAPAERIAPEVLEKVTRWAQTLMDHWEYVGLGALEFLVDDQRAYLIHGSARLNSNFELWNRIAETRAVAWQWAALENYAPTNLPEIRKPENWLHGVYLRIYAEDAVFQLPQPGYVHDFSSTRVWQFLGARAELNWNYQKGEMVNIFDTGLLGTLCVCSIQREQLWEVVSQILKELWISGTVQTNEHFLNELISHSWVKEEIFHAGFVDEEFIPTLSLSFAELSICVSVVSQYLSRQNPVLLSKIRYWQVADQYLKPEQTTLNVEWLGEPEYGMGKINDGISGWIRTEEGVRRVSAVFLIFPQRWLVRLGLKYIWVRLFLEKEGKIQTSVLSALVSGRVHALLYRENVSVAASQVLVVIESMGRLIPHAILFPSQVIRWKVSAKETVTFGQELAEIQVYKTP